MRKRVAQSAIPVTVLVVLSTVVYGRNIDNESLRPHEVRIEQAGFVLATHAWHDERGRRLPLFFEASDDTWLTPVPVYGVAILHALGSPNPVRSRVLTVCAGVADVIVLYCLAYQVFLSGAVAFVAALILLVEPAHFALSRQATADGVWAVPFLLLWLVGLAAFLRTRSRLSLSIAAAALAAAVYAQPSAPLLVFLLSMTGIAGIRRATGARSADMLCAGGTALAVLVPLLVWFILHPTAYVNTFGRWFLHPAHIRNPLAWGRSLTNWFNLTVWVELYWDFFDPMHLFVDYDAPALAGVFLLPVGALMIVGVSDLRGPRTNGSLDKRLLAIVLLSIMLSPVVVAAFKEPRTIERVLIVVPLGALLAAGGVQALWTARSMRARTVLAVLLVITVVQFSLFYTAQ